MIYHNRGEHANHYTTDAVNVCMYGSCSENIVFLFVCVRIFSNSVPFRLVIGLSKFALEAILFSYLMVAGAIDRNIFPEVLGMTKGSIARGHWPSAIEPMVIPWTKGQMFQSIARNH